MPLGYLAKAKLQLGEPKMRKISDRLTFDTEFFDCLKFQPVAAFSMVTARAEQGISPKQLNQYSRTVIVATTRR